MPFSLFPPSPFFHPLYLRSTHVLRHCSLSDGLLSTPLCENVSIGRGRGTFVNVTEGIGGLAAARVCIIFTTSRHHQSPISAHTLVTSPLIIAVATLYDIESNQIESNLRKIILVCVVRVVPNIRSGFAELFPPLPSPPHIRRKAEQVQICPRGAAREGKIRKRRSERQRVVLDRSVNVLEKQETRV